MLGNWVGDSSGEAEGVCAPSAQKTVPSAHMKMVRRVLMAAATRKLSLAADPYSSTLGNVMSQHAAVREWTACARGSTRSLTTSPPTQIPVISHTPDDTQPYADT